MENTNTNNKIITVSFMAAGLLIGLVASIILSSAAAIATGAVGRFLARDFILHVLPVALGFATFIYLQFNKKTLSWADEVVTEIRRVVWPTRPQTTAMTVVVCIMLLISGVVLGLMDVISANVIEVLLNFSWSGLF